MMLIVVLLTAVITSLVISILSVTGKDLQQYPYSMVSKTPLGDYIQVAAKTEAEIRSWKTEDAVRDLKYELYELAAGLGYTRMSGDPKWVKVKK